VPTVNFKKEQVRKYTRHHEKFDLKGYNDNGNDDDDDDDDDNNDDDDNDDRGNDSGEF
jgi:hypothetical protein